MAEICPLPLDVSPSAVVFAVKFRLPPLRCTLMVSVSLKETVVPLVTFNAALASSVPSFNFHAKFLNCE